MRDGATENQGKVKLGDAAPVFRPSWNRVGDFWVKSARKAGIARGFCISRDAIFGMNSGWHEHRNATGGYGIRIRLQAFARSPRCAEFSVTRRRA